MSAITDIQKFLTTTKIKTWNPTLPPTPPRQYRTIDFSIALQLTIWERVSKGESQGSVARDLGISQGGISKVLKRLSRTKTSRKK